MRSNYKQLGSYISEVNIKNTKLEVNLLLGVSITKKFIPSIANTIGTDMSKYKIVRQDQFGYGPITSRNGDKISVALLTEDQCIISTSYRVFEIIDKEKLLPEYLMMWFRRPEFDRYARFMSHGSTREAFDWDEMCETELPIPTIEKQREIVKEYNTIVNRIKLNEQLNQKLEETAQTLYRHWFVDFEFPDEKGKPYKSSGGKMLYNEELEQEIPMGWEQTTLGSLLKSKGYIRGPFGSALKKDDMIPVGVPVYEQKHAIDDHRNFRYFISEDKHKTLARFTVEPNDMVISCSGTLGRVAMIKMDDPLGVINQALLILRPNPNRFKPICLYYYLTSKKGNNSLIENSSGSAQINIAKRETIQSIPFVLPPSEIQDEMEQNLLVVIERINLLKKETKKLIEFINIVLSKMSKAESFQSSKAL
jgi:type I restriction enzyme, S subunit